MSRARHSSALAPAMRRLLILAAVLVFLAGLQLYVFPLRTADWFAWTIEVPMTAVFLGAAYWSSAVLEVAGAGAPDWDRARLAVWTVLVFTALTLVVTLVHLPKFHLGAEHPGSARAVTVGWLAVYVVVPVVMVALAWVQSRAAAGRTTGPTGRHRPPAGLRLLLVALALVLLGLGLALLLVPVDAARLWPWPLTELTARAVGAWLVGLGWAAGHARLVDDLPAIRPLGLTGTAFVLLQALALARYGDDLDWGGAPAVGYLAGLVAVGVVAGWILLAVARVRGAAGTASASPR